MRTVQIQCAGRVQGVFFRKYATEQAQALGLPGWVKNQMDGSVLIQVAGNHEQIEAFIRWCHQGSPLSVVEKVMFQEVANVKDLPYPFQIRY